MIKKLHLAFLWHMHQPMYLDPLTERFIMPWVRLHALKDYLDIPQAMLDAKNAKFNINFVPSLLTQLDDYIESKHMDDYLEFAYKNPDWMSPWEKEFVIKNFFNINREKIVFKSRRYKELYHKKNNMPPEFWSTSFSPQDIRDLQILFHLGWSGTALIKNSTLLKELIKKDSDFTENEKTALLNEQYEYLKTIRDFIKGLASNKNVEVSITPFYHPIIPVMNDIQNVPKAWSNSILPNNFQSMREYSQKHVDCAHSFAKKYFGKEISGMWPAEGSVSIDLVDILKETPTKWIATDEAILAKTLNRAPQINESLSPHHFDGVDIFFRNHALSDKIGFVYSNWGKEDAVKDFIHELLHIKSVTTKEDALVCVILDGENAWEYYEDNGEPFLTHLFDEISKQDWLQLTTFSEYSENHRANIINLSTLMPGSWIDGNFNTWINEQTKNRYWEILFKLQTLIETSKKTGNIDKSLENEIDHNFMVAQGSDWMWWAGEGHSSANDLDFDQLFRNYVSKVYQLLGLEIPFELTQPLYSQNIHVSYTEPLRLIHPKITGMLDDYFGWSSSGEILSEQGAIHKTDVIIKKILFGFDEYFIYFQISLYEDIEVFKENGHQIELEIVNYKKINLKKDRNIIYKDVEVIETAIPISYIDSNLTTKDKINFRFNVLSNGNTIERIPHSETVEIKIPDESFDMENWCV